MAKYTGRLAAILMAGLAGSFAAAPGLVQAQLQLPCTIGADGEQNFCNGDPGGGGGGGGTQATYTLQGVIQHQGNDRDSGGGMHAKIRGYSRFADQNNNRVDADYIEVRCTAYGPTGTTTDYDDETNGALVDVHFYSSGYPPVGGSGIVNVQCTHHAEHNGLSYDATSTTQIFIQNYP